MLYVSGVVLANASLDIAFHDTVLIVSLGSLVATQPSLLSMASTQPSLNLNDNPNPIDSFDNSSYDSYIKQFWVGLMDGDGSIQVNHWRKKNLQYRLVIKLANLKSNHNMLIRIAKVVGGTVRIANKDEDVLWVVNSKEEIREIIKIYESYPPLTSRKICQLAFLKACLRPTSMEWYLANRDLKFNKQLNIIKSNVNFSAPSYFKGWLSGFIESEGCFSLRINNNHSFSIGQNDDFYLINYIKQFFEASNMVRNPYGKFYSVEIYKRQVVLDIINHCTNYPLLGGKLESLKKFNQKLLN